MGYEPFAPIEKKLIWSLYYPQLVVPGLLPYGNFSSLHHFGFYFCIPSWDLVLVIIARYLVYVEPIIIYQSFVPLFTGKVAGHYFNAYIEQLLLPSTELEVEEENNGEDPPLPPPLIVATTPENVTEFVETRGRELLQQIAVTIVAQPFRVIAIRCMSSIVEKDSSSK